MVVEREWLEVVLQEDDAVKKIVKLLDINSEPAVGVGENFASSINRVQLEAVLGNGKMAKKSLILKKLPDGEKRNDFLASQSFFGTEIKMYIDILPGLEEILREQGVPPLWPGFLGLKDNVLIFSDLRSKNYKVQCRKTRLDLAHALLAVRTLAIFHAGSVVLKRRGLIDPSEMEPYYLGRDHKSIKRLATGGIKRLASVMEAEWGPEWSEISSRLYKKGETCFDELIALRQYDEERLNVLCHGDLWTTNLLFKYSHGLDTPIGVRFIDFQLSHFNSYAFDLLYFMNCSLPADVRRQNKEIIVENYLKTLKESLTYHGYPELAPTMEEAEKEMSRLELFRFLFLVSITPICIAESENALNFDDLFVSDGMAQSADIYRGKYKKEIDQELLEWVKTGLL